MNNLLLEQPIYINRLFISIAGQVEAGIFLDYLFKKFSGKKTNIINLNINEIKKELFFYDLNIQKIHKKLIKLPFLTIKYISENNYSYTIELEKYEQYLRDLK